MRSAQADVAGAWGHCSINQAGGRRAALLLINNGIMSIKWHATTEGMKIMSYIVNVAVLWQLGLIYGLRHTISEKFSLTS